MKKLLVLLAILNSNLLNLLAIDQNTVFVIEPYTKQGVTYTKITTKPNNLPVTNADVLGERGVYRKMGTDFYKLNYSLPLDVRFFGAIGDGKTDDSQAVQDAINYCSSLGITLNCGSGRYLITKGLTAGCSIIFDAPTYGSNVNSGFLVCADGITALTLTPGIKTSKNITIHGNNRLSNGMFINNNFLSRHENIRIFNLNGFGFKGLKIYDTQFDNISVELCGSETEYAFSMLGGNDTWNTSTINRLQVEQSKFKAIFFDPLGLSCVINNIHSERSTGVPADNAPSFVFGGNRCQYNTIRVQSAAAQKVLLTGSNSTFINCLFEQGLQKVIAEGINGNSLILIGTDCQCPFEEKTNQIGKILINGGNLNRIQGYHNNAVYNDATIGTFAFGFSNDPVGAEFHNCKIGSVESDLSSTVNAARFDGCIINTLKDLPRSSVMKNTSVKSGVANIFYKNLCLENSTLTPTVRIDFGSLKANHSTIEGNLIHQAGPKKYLFSNLIVAGTVSKEFLAQPDIAPVKGLKHEILGSADYWFVKDNAGIPSWASSSTP
jgi:hypothetical protein